MADEPEKQTEAEGEKDDEESESKGGLLRAIILLVILLAVLAILVGGVWLGYSMFFSGGEVAAGSGDSENDEADEYDIFDPEKPPGILDFQNPFLVRLRKDESILSSDVYLKVDIALEVASKEAQDEMEKNPVIMTRINDTINTYLASKYPSEVENRNWSRLKKELIELINEQLPEKYHIKRMNFKGFLTQPR